MEVFLDCLPCMLRQVLEASRMATNQSEIQAAVMDKSVRALAGYKNYSCSPEIVCAMHKIVKELTGVNDPYKKIKERDLRAAKEVLPLLEQFQEKTQNSLYWSLKIAAVGNILDSAINGNVNIQSCVEQELWKEFKICDINILEDKLTTAGTILIIGDNAGETVFDKVFLNSLSPFQLVYAVRDEPVINDATIQEAISSGLSESAEIISTGCSAPAAILEQCSAEFLNIFNRAEIVISKGQGNFEALSDCGRTVFFLLKAKCPVIAEKLGVDLNDYVFRYHEPDIFQ